MADDFFNKIVLAGWIKKKGSRGNTWGDRYFVLKGADLLYYIKQNDTEPKGILHLSPACKVSEIKSNITKKHKHFMFKILWPLDEIDDGKRKKEGKSSSYYGYLSGAISSVWSSNPHAVHFDIDTTAKEKSIYLSCDNYNDAERWTFALIHQIHQLAMMTSSTSTTTIHSTTSQSQFSTDIGPSLAPPPDIRLDEVEDWLKSIDWKVYEIKHGVRILELDTDEKPIDPIFKALTTVFSNTSTVPSPPCLRINLSVMASINEVFAAITMFPSECRTGIIKSFRIVENIDNSTDIIHIALNPIYIYPTWTAPRDFCLMRYWKQNADGSYIICMDSTVNIDCPLLPGYVRADLHAAYIISPIKNYSEMSGDGEDEPMECMLTFIAQMNPNGWIWPEFKYRQQMLAEYMLHVLDVRDNLEVDRFVQAHFDPFTEARVSMSNLAHAAHANSSSTKSNEGLIATITPPTLPPEAWADVDATTIRVRGPTYHLDKVKTLSQPALFKCIAIDLFEVAENSMNICSHPKNRVAMALERGDPSWVFVLNIMIPGPPFLSFMAYFQGDRSLIEEDTPFGRIAKRFFHGSDDEFRNNRFKLIPKIVDGNMLIKMAVKDTPALLGNKLKTYYHKGENYFEIDVDVGSSSIARNVVGLAIGYSKAIVVDMAMCLQGDDENELPEIIIGGVTCIRMDCSKAKKLS